MRSVISHHRQFGAVIVTTALLMLFLLGFMGIALDFGHLFIVKTELQTAMDSCALAAAQELDGNATTSLTRARSAGRTAGNLNRVNMQSVNWSAQGQLIDADITFKDGSYAATTVSANARYAQCQHTQPAIQMWLLHALGASSGSTLFPNTRSVGALAVATRASAQSACPLPVGLKPKTAGAAAPNYGYTVGEWVTLLYTPGGGVATNGQIGWANLDGSSSASETVAELNGFCGTAIGNTLGTPGAQATVADVWNGRFGIYKAARSPSLNNPDFTGYAYTATNWPAGQNAYKGAPGAGAPASAQNFVTKRAAFASCADTGTNFRGGANSCESITGLTINGGFQNPLAAPGNVGGGHRDFGRNRRIVTVPIINAGSGVLDFACMLMLQPLTIPMTDSKLEFIGNAGAVDSPCTTSTQAGGTSGPLVPTLVR